VLGRSHNGELKGSATSQDENQDERAQNGDNQGADTSEAVGKEREHYFFKSPLLPHAVFIR
jgi:hypothetical protein